MNLPSYNETVYPWYKCDTCGSHGVKLWRKSYITTSDLMCSDCLMAEYGDNYTKIGDGKFVCHKIKNCIVSDKIADRVPAVPYSSDRNDGYWGYCAVPEDMVDWFNNLD